jgi:hypothetical protein
VIKKIAPIIAKARKDSPNTVRRWAALNVASFAPVRISPVALRVAVNPFEHTPMADLVSLGETIKALRGFAETA